MSLIHQVDNTTKDDIRYCKRCKCELPSNNRGAYCPNCRGKQGGKMRNVLLSIGAVAIAPSVMKKMKEKIPDVKGILQVVKSIKP